MDGSIGTGSQTYQHVNLREMPPHMTSRSQAGIALKWLTAISEQDRKSLREITAEDIAIHGPDEIARGISVTDQYFTDLLMRITVHRVAVKGHEVVVFHHIDFLDADGATTDSIDNAALMTVIGGKVASYRRARPDDDLETGFTPVDM